MYLSLIKGCLYRYFQKAWDWGVRLSLGLAVWGSGLLFGFKGWCAAQG